MDKCTKVEAIDIFCGIGGLTNGLLEAGIQVVAGLDNDESCQYPYEINNGARFIHADVTNFNFQDLNSLFSTGSKKILVGCAPCQPFSTHSHKNRKKDERWDLIKYFLLAVQKVQPDIVSVENVPGFMKTNVFQDFVSSIESMGYKVDYKKIYCPDYGIPQNRRRMVLLASKKMSISIPQPKCSKENYTTVQDVIKNLPSLYAGEKNSEDQLHYCKSLSETNIARIKQSKPGRTWKDWDEYLLPNCYKKETGKTYTSVYGRMSWNKVAPTITTQFFNYGSGRFGHPEQNRALSLREGALLQTFRQDYDFGEVNSLTRISRHIGNAVPPKLGKAIGEKILEVLNEQ